MLEVKRLTEMDNTKKSTTAILSNAIGVNIQSGQSGGGSPNFRGLEANRLLLVLDGVSLNSTIFRSGHLQNSATISPYFIEKIALLTGPGAISFGDGALANAIVFKTLAPSFTEDNKLFFSQHFESSSNLTSLNVKMLYGNKRIANITVLKGKFFPPNTLGKNVNASSG